MMLEPLEREMSLLSLGSSVGTVGDMEGEVIVVKSFDELDKMAQSVRYKNLLVMRRCNLNIATCRDMYLITTVFAAI